MTVNLTAYSGTETATHVVSFNVQGGRQTKTDPYSSLSASIVVNASAPPASWVLGAAISVDIDSNQIIQGYITNVDYNYDFVANADTCTISLEGYLSFFGRSILTNFVMNNENIGISLAAIAAALTGTGKTITQYQIRSYTDTSTYSGAAQNLVTALVSTEQGRIDDAKGLKVLGRDFSYADFNDTPPIIPSFNFADDGTANYIKYDNITFSSLSNNYFTYTQIQPALFAQQTAGSGGRVLSLSTYDTSTTQAANLANYTLAEFDQSGSVPVSITTRQSLGSNSILLSTFVNYRVGTRSTIKFRGNTYQAIVEGYQISANPSDVSYTFFLSGFEQNNFLRLDDPTYGSLDYNNLNF